MNSKTRNRESGAILIMFAIFLALLLAFAALAMEAGRWYLVRAELSKTVDAAALIAAKNISNPNVDPLQLAREFSAENFPSGFLGTPSTGAGTPVFIARMVGNDKIEVEGHVSATAIFARIVGFDLIPVSSLGIAQKRRVEIMLVLDRSGSMAGQDMTQLKTAAKTFVEFFEDTQAEDKLGLITFASSVRVDRGLGTNYVAQMTTSINAMNALGSTNPEDALDQSDGPLGFTDQTGVNPQDRIQQFVIFFSDGQPTSFRDIYKYQDVNYDGVVTVGGNCDPGDLVLDWLYSPTVENTRVRTQAGNNDVSAYPTGDGLANGSACGNGNTTRWMIFQAYPVPGGYGPIACNIPRDTRLSPYVCSTASTLAVAQATTLKNKNIKIYAIGLGSGIRDQFLQQLSSGQDFYYKAPTGGELEALFQKVAQDIKLRLVQ